MLWIHTYFYNNYLSLWYVIRFPKNMMRNFPLIILHSYHILHERISGLCSIYITIWSKMAYYGNLWVNAHPHIAYKSQIPGGYGYCTNGLASIQLELESNRTCLGHDGKTGPGSQSPVNSLADLRNALQEIWDSISQEDICTLLNIMPRWLTTVIPVHGGNALLNYFCFCFILNIWIC